MQFWPLLGFLECQQYKKNIERLRNKGSIINNKIIQTLNMMTAGIHYMEFAVIFFLQNSNEINSSIITVF